MKINLGCYNVTKKGFINCDLANADKNFDFNVYPYPFKDDSCDYFYSKDTLDHLDNFFSVMNEIYRICKHGATVEILVPFYNCHTSYAPTHKEQINLLYFLMYTKEEREADTPETERKVKGLFEITSVKTRGYWFIPDFKIGKHITFRYLVAMHIPNVANRMIVKMKCIKELKTQKEE